MSKCFIMRGLPGSGKSYISRAIYDNFYDTIVSSTDNYWIRPDGFYDFNYKRLSEAHAWNWQMFQDNIVAYGKTSCYSVDNTNITLKDCKQYIDHALSEGLEVYLIEPNNPWSWDVNECFKRNTHRVPLESIQRMKDKWETSESIQQKCPHIEILKGYDEVTKKFGKPTRI